MLDIEPDQLSRKLRSLRERRVLELAQLLLDLTEAASPAADFFQCVVVFMPMPKRMRSTRAVEGASTRVVVSRIDWIAASIGETYLSSMKSPDANLPPRSGFRARSAPHDRAPCVPRAAAW